MEITNAQEVAIKKSGPPISFFITLTIVALITIIMAIYSIRHKKYLLLSGGIIGIIFAFLDTYVGYGIYGFKLFYPIFYVLDNSYCMFKGGCGEVDFILVSAIGFLILGCLIGWIVSWIIGKIKRN